MAKEILIRLELEQDDESRIIIYLCRRTLTIVIEVVYEGEIEDEEVEIKYVFFIGSDRLLVFFGMTIDSVHSDIPGRKGAMQLSNAYEAAMDAFLIALADGELNSLLSTQERTVISRIGVVME